MTFKNTRQASKVQEERIAKLLNGKRVANSGATAFNKGDVRVGKNILVECKTLMKEKDSFSIKKEWLIKNKEESFSMGIDYTFLAFSFGDDNDYFVIDKKMMKKLIEEIKE